mmetsp:Transcript_166976/g.531040  ORF Transcript_166976/g.531040 Transcript_166976/m.531040 type:complete len:103 (+) Transcript_166976:168-476(+)
MARDHPYGHPMTKQRTSDLHKDSETGNVRGLWHGGRHVVIRVGRRFAKLFARRAPQVPMVGLADPSAICVIQVIHQHMGLRHGGEQADPTRSLQTMRLTKGQ